MARTTVAERKLVGARELKTRLGSYLKAVERGATITVSRAGCRSPSSPP